MSGGSQKPPLPSRERVGVRDGKPSTSTGIHLIVYCVLGITTAATGAQNSIDNLFAALTNGSREVRFQAVNALAAQGPTVIPVVLDSLKKQLDGNVQEALRAVLWYRG